MNSDEAVVRIGTVYLLMIVSSSMMLAYSIMALVVIIPAIVFSMVIIKPVVKMWP